MYFIKNVVGNEVSLHSEFVFANLQSWMGLADKTRSCEIQCDVFCSEIIVFFSHKCKIPLM